MEKWLNDIKLRAGLGKPPVFGGRSNKFGKISFDDLIFIPAQLEKDPVDYFREKILTETVIGKLSKHPMKLNTPIMIAAMSFGAVSDQTKVVLAKASSETGIATNTGEGGMLPEERKAAKLLVAQYSTGRFGVDENYLKSADAIEIKIGQGAKPGQGGLLPGSKVTEKIAKVRKLRAGQPIHSPPNHLDIHTIEELRDRIDEIRKIINGKPVFLKLGAGNIEKDIELAVEAGPDVIAVDGMSGGTAAAPSIMLNDFGLPTIPALVKARHKLDELGAKQELLIGGGLNKGPDIAKALALGADGVFMATSLLVAMGCTYCKMCSTGKCPAGLTTQDPEYKKRLNQDKALKGLVNFINCCTEEIKMAAGAAGKNNVHELSQEDLRSMSLLMEKVSGITIV